MLDQEDDPDLYDEWLTADEQLTCFSKGIKKIVGRFKGEYLLFVKGLQYYEEEVFLRDRVTRRTESTSVREPGTDWNHVPIGQSQNYGSSDNSQEIPVSMENVRLEETEDQSVTSPIGEALGRNVHVRL